MRIVVSVALILFVMSCKTAMPMASSASKDIASNAADTKNSSLWLYYLEGNAIVRTHCPPNQLIRNRTVCTLARDARQWGPSLSLMSEGIGANISYYEAVVQTYFKKIADLDQMLIIKVAGQATTATDSQSLSSELANIEASIGETQLKVNALASQIGAIESKLKTEFNPDLRAQLGTLQEERGKIVESLGVLNTKASDARGAFVAAHGSVFNKQFFSDLQGQRQGHVDRLNSAKKDFEAVLLEVASFNLLISMLKDPTFTLDLLTTEPQFQQLKVLAYRLDIPFGGKDAREFVFAYPKEGDVICRRFPFQAHWEALNPATAYPADIQEEISESNWVGLQDIYEVKTSNAEYLNLPGREHVLGEFAFSKTTTRICIRRTREKGRYLLHEPTCTARFFSDWREKWDPAVCKNVSW